jgi:hypothetical protein
MLLETNSQTGFAITAALGLIIFIMHQIYEVDPTSARELARLAICFHFIWPSMICNKAISKSIDLLMWRSPSPFHPFSSSPFLLYLTPFNTQTNLHLIPKNYPQKTAKSQFFVSKCRIAYICTVSISDADFLRAISTLQ